MAEFISIGTGSRPLEAYPEHRHIDAWEVCLYTAGEGVAIVSGQEIPFVAGRILIFPPRTAHHERSASGFTSVHLQVRHWVAPRRGAVVVHDDANGSFRTLAEQLQRTFSLKQAGWHEDCQQMCDVLLLYLARWSAARGRSSDVVDRLVQLFFSNLHRHDWGVADALRQVNCSDDQARRLFFQATGKTPAAYLGELRLATAKRHLISGLTVASAAERSGYASHHYFARVFTSKVGCSPSTYARRALAHALRRNRMADPSELSRDRDQPGHGLLV